MKLHIQASKGLRNAVEAANLAPREREVPHIPCEPSTVINIIKQQALVGTPWREMVAGLKHKDGVITASA